jgi:hypothetical protein
MEKGIISLLDLRRKREARVVEKEEVVASGTDNDSKKERRTSEGRLTTNKHQTST